jgi:23S rRNA (cytidine1920-2'-O)/16S rRNA (cytidine1409-2'-O)-methyltransferase
MDKKRLDVLIVEKGLIESRAQAQRVIMAGQVRVKGQVVLKPSLAFSDLDEITVDHGPKFVSRGGEKLEAALIAFNLKELHDFICADVGASTGGFTDCLLVHGARRVYAIDVGHGVLHWKLRNDERVVSMEKTNVRFLDRLEEMVDLVSIDVSFISVQTVLTVIKKWFKQAGGTAVVLIKPQFEAGKAEAARGKGVIRGAEIHRRVIKEVLETAVQEGFEVVNIIVSPLKGPKGNIEFLAHLTYPCKQFGDISPLIDKAIDDSQPLEKKIGIKAQVLKYTF